MSADETPPINVYLRGTNGNVPLVDLVSVAGALRTCLKHIERCYFGDEAIEEYEVTHAKKGSLDMLVEPKSKSPRYQRVRDGFIGTLKRLERGESIDPLIDFRALHGFQQFNGAINRHSVLKIDGLSLTESFVDSLARIMQPIHKSHGSVSGRLEAVSVHGHRHFSLYPAHTGEEVTCTFADRQLLPKVVDALERHVTVYGLLHYSQGKVFPERVEVADLTIHPPAESLSTLLEPIDTLDLKTPSEEAVRALRNEWH